MKFEWDEKKAKTNFEKHGVDFNFATEVFSDAFAVETNRVVNGEERIQIIGRIDKYIVSIAYMERSKH